MRSTGETKVISIRLHEAQIKELDRLAGKSGRNRSEFLQQGISFFLGYWRHEVLKEDSIAEVLDKTLD